MNARQCLEFLNWFNDLPGLKSVFLDSADAIELRILSGAHIHYMETAISLNLIERFPWLSEELFAIGQDFDDLAKQAKTSERNELLRVATIKREKEAKNKARLFLNKRAQWEHDPRVSQLERLTRNLEDEKSNRILLNERAKMRRVEYLDSLNKLSFVHVLKSCDQGVFRLTPTGELIRDRLLNIGADRCHGWSLSDMLTAGHLLSQ